MSKFDSRVIWVEGIMNGLSNFLRVRHSTD